MSEHPHNYPKLRNAATAGVEVVNIGGEPPVGLRYSGHAAREIGEHRKQNRLDRRACPPCFPGTVTDGRELNGNVR